jgi:hypothetical protein
VIAMRCQLGQINSFYPEEGDSPRASAAATFSLPKLCVVCG